MGVHECPECQETCYCDLDDSNDARGGDECVHDCQYEAFVCGEVDEVDQVDDD